MITVIKSFVVLLNLLWLGWAWWRSADLPHKTFWRAAAVMWFATMVGIFFWLNHARSTSDQVAVPNWPLGIAYIWHLLMLMPLALVVLLGELSRAIYLAPRRRHRADDTHPADAPDNSNETPDHEPAHPAGLSRRDFLKATALTAPPLLALGSGTFGHFQSDHFRTRRIDVPVPGLPRELDGFTIAHLSDVHAGKFVDEALMRRMADTTNNLRPDMTLITGDLIDFSLSDLPKALDAVRRLDAPAGVFMCEGNHDLFQSRERFEQTVRAADVGLLINQTENVLVRGREIQLLGLRWGLDRPSQYRSVYADLYQADGRSFADNAEWKPWRDDAGAAVHLQALAPQINPDATRIVLAHHPHAFDAAAQSGAALTLAGHTHGGQLMLTKNLGAGPMMYRYWSGLYRKGNSHLVVSNGAGNWLPLRINAPAEIVHITLRAVEAVT